MSFKKIFLVITFLAVSIGAFVMNTPITKAMTAEELLTEINRLQTQIAQLQTQLAEIQGKPAVWCHDFNVNLKINDEGTEVKALQLALGKDGDLVYDKNTNGIFDEYCASAVVGFQEKYKSEILTPLSLMHGTGYVGSATRAKLNKLYGCGIACVQVITPAKNLTTNECKNFPTPCDVPAGWVKVDSCPTSSPSITVLSPNGGETWKVGETKRISWNASGVSYVRIYIYDPTIYGSGSTNYIDGVLSANTGYYDWTIVQNILPGYDSLPRNYKIRIDGVNSTNEGAQVITNDSSDNYFSIASTSSCRDENSVCAVGSTPCCTGLKSVPLAFPGTDGACIAATCGSICRPCGNGVCDANENKCNCPEDCTTIKTCSNHAQCSQACDNIGVSLKWSGIGSNYKAWTGTCPSSIYGCMTGNCCIGQCDLQQGSCLCQRTDVVDIYGSVCPSGQTCGTDCYCHTSAPKDITVISPNGGESWVVGNTYNITWKANGFEKVVITLTDYSCSSEVVMTIATNISASQGSYSWKIPDNLFGSQANAYCPSYIYNSSTHYGWKSGDNFKIFIAELKTDGTYGVQDESDNYFSIVLASSATCTDSDSGKDYYVKGYGTGIYPVGNRPANTYYIFSKNCISPCIKTSNEQFDTYYDHCYDDNQINEAFCGVDGSLQAMGIICPNGCSDGACKSSTTASCIDSDGGINFNVKGTVQTKDSISSGTYYDLCWNGGNDLHEWSCNGTQAKETIYTCPNGCQDGACNPTPPPPLTFKYLENQLASVTDAVFQLMEGIKKLGR